MISSIYFSENYLYPNHLLFYTEYTVISTFFLFIAVILIRNRDYLLTPNLAFYFQMRLYRLLHFIKLIFFGAN